MSTEGSSILGSINASNILVLPANKAKSALPISLSKGLIRISIEMSGLLALRKL